MIKNLLKTMLPVVLGAVVSLFMFSCSDDDDDAPQTVITIADAKFDTFQPEGFVKIHMSVSGADAQLSADAFGISRFQSSSFGNLETGAEMPIIEPESIKKDAEGYILTIRYNINGIYSTDVSFQLAYDNVEIPGVIRINMKRAHLSETHKIINSSLQNTEVVEFPVYEFLDKLNIERMDVQAIGIREQLFISKNKGVLYPALSANTDNLYFEKAEVTADGVLKLTGMTNAKYGQIYSLINKIKLTHPDKDGNEYVWVEFIFGFKPVK